MKHLYKILPWIVCIALAVLLFLGKQEAIDSRKIYVATDSITTLQSTRKKAEILHPKIVKKIHDLETHLRVDIDPKIVILKKAVENTTQVINTDQSALIEAQGQKIQLLTLEIKYLKQSNNNLMTINSTFKSEIEQMNVVSKSRKRKSNGLTIKVGLGGFTAGYLVGRLTK